MIIWSVIFFAFFSFAYGLGAQDVSAHSQCYSFGEGQVYPQETRHSFGHQMHTSKTQISKEAPFWQGTAVVNGEFKDLNLTMFRGKYLVFFFFPLSL